MKSSFILSPNIISIPSQKTSSKKIFLPNYIIGIQTTSRIKKIKDNSSTKAYIIQKAKVDNHYVIREIIKEIKGV